MATMSILGLYHSDPQILKPLTDVLPAAIDPEDLQVELLSETAELETLYTDPIIFKQILKAWTAGRKDVWNRIANALAAEYNITENYDRSESWTDTGNGSSDSHNYMRGFPENEGMIEQSKGTSAGSSSSTHTGRVHGNIGVRSAQELVTQEIDLAYKADLEEIIIKDFKSRFCLLVY